MKKILFMLTSPLIMLACSKSHTITEVAPFKHTLKLHEKFHITLPENHTTGYLWQMGKEYDTKVADYMNSVWHGNEKGVDFNFEATEKGQTQLEFTLIKYQDTLETKQFIIEVN